jgi:hypothetical protein
VSRALGLSWQNDVTIHYLVVKWKGYETDREDEVSEPECILERDAPFLNGGFNQGRFPFVVLLRCVPE